MSLDIPGDLTLITFVRSGSPSDIAANLRGRVPDFPPAVEELHRLFAAATIAHERIHVLHRQLIDLGVADANTAQLVRDSANLILREMPQAARDVQRLEKEWDEQRLLDATAADRTLDAIQSAIAQARPRLIDLRASQDGLVRQMQELVERTRGR